MKKFFTLFMIMLSALLTTACVNNKAVEELNQKALEYLKKGDTQSAISRLESSLDLDSSFFATRYNLAVAYIEAQDYMKAQEHLQEALKLDSKNPDVYYSLGVTQENIAREILEDKNATEEESTDTVVHSPVLSPEQLAKGIGFLEESIKSFEKYLELNKEAKDKADVLNEIESIKMLIEKYQAQGAQ
jgi:Tfp pilus assembly protein PilF